MDLDPTQIGGTAGVLGLLVWFMRAHLASMDRQSAAFVAKLGELVEAIRSVSVEHKAEVLAVGEAHKVEVLALLARNDKLTDRLLEKAA